MGFPYTKKMDSIGVFLNHVANDGTPAKVDLSHLQTLGLTSSNDRPLVPLFKALGFVNRDGTPTERWSEYRDEDSDDGEGEPIIYVVEGSHPDHPYAPRGLWDFV